MLAVQMYMMNTNSQQLEWWLRSNTGCTVWTLGVLRKKQALRWSGGKEIVASRVHSQQLFNCFFSRFLHQLSFQNICQNRLAQCV